MWVTALSFGVYIHDMEAEYVHAVNSLFLFFLFLSLFYLSLLPVSIFLFLLFLFFFYLFSPERDY